MRCVGKYLIIYPHTEFGLGVFGAEKGWLYHLCAPITTLTIGEDQSKMERIGVLPSEKASVNFTSKRVPITLSALLLRFPSAVT